MDFVGYTRVIVESVADCGYDRFMPSLCIAEEPIELQVLDTALQPDGDKQVALDWASTFAESGRVLYCAYRNGDRCIEVVEVTGTEVTDKLHITARPDEADR